MTNYSFKVPRSLNYRLWHWINAIVILGLLGTVLLRKTFLSWRTNSALIEAKLLDAGTPITAELAKDIAVSIRNPLWDWHIYLGYALTALIVWRVISFIFERSCPTTSFVRAVCGIKHLDPLAKKSAIHYSAVKFTYVLFYLATFFMVVTGIMLTFKTELALSKDLAGSVKEYHELMMWFFVGFVVVHIAGVILIEFTKAPGVISDMINGKRN